MVEYSFVLDLSGNRLSPCNKNKAYYLIRKNKAKMFNKFPMVIQLLKIVKENINDKTENCLGIDDGSKHVGVAIIQDFKNKIKPVFKGSIELRQDVSKKMAIRKDHRQYRRYHKRHRPKRFDNRKASKKKNRLAPTITQKKQSILRPVNKINKWIKIDSICLEDVMIDIRKVIEGKKLYKWQYQESNRLDNNIRIATLKRDNFTCVDCGSKENLQEHHIKPKRAKGADSIYNLITLCKSCHTKTFGKELQLMDKYFAMIKGKKLNLKDAMHVIQGKKYLQTELKKIAPLFLTTSGDTANHRIDWNVEKTHSNNALVIYGLDIKSINISLNDWQVTPLRKKSKGDTELIVEGFKNRDCVKYIKKDGTEYIGYITALYPKKNQFNMVKTNGDILKNMALKA